MYKLPVVAQLTLSWLGFQSQSNLMLGTGNAGDAPLVHLRAKVKINRVTLKWHAILLFLVILFILIACIPHFIGPHDTAFRLDDRNLAHPHRVNETVPTFLLGIFIVVVSVVYIGIAAIFSTHPWLTIYYGGIAFGFGFAICLGSACHVVRLISKNPPMVLQFDRFL